MDTISADHFRVRDRFQLDTGEGPITARAERADRYPVHVVRSRREAHRLLGELIGPRQVAVVLDSRVEALYGPQMLSALRAGDRLVMARSVPSGEASKSLEQAVELLRWLATTDIARRDVVLNLGGGVVNDLGGWVASTYMRGLPYVNVPTTLLAMVDGALGGKLGVNHASAKNLLGGFAQPEAVVADVSFLASLDRRHVAAGLAECIKKAVIASPDYFEFIEAHSEALLAAEPEHTAVLVRSAAAIKTGLVARDPYEQDLRRPLNFGHTVGHPVETISGYGPLLHGEAVAFGMCVEARISAARGWLPECLLERLEELLTRCSLPVRADELRAEVDMSALLAAMEKVRLIRDGGLKWVLPVALGDSVIVDDVGDDEILRALAECGVDDVE